ncbi:type II toxin-antitoxin system RelE/ParE family toxin [Antarctobacter sp.]|uniref:type II toxin-antitoxin system RelE/ParE family toxin n=1 Tax=Antarctobacter sp. TaxID=1872577 RepID=UPI002B26A916|nr:type II toxin-antitoxin system RelE/ParE family toxin [Antarctobacter sp.]
MARPYRLTPAAQADLDAIWDHTVAAWSMDQAEAFLRGLEDVLRLLCAHPEMARERFETTPPVPYTPIVSIW